MQLMYLCVYLPTFYSPRVVALICSPSNDSYYLILSSQPMISGEFIFKVNTEIKYEKGNIAGRLFSTATAITTYIGLNFPRCSGSEITVIIRYPKSVLHTPPRTAYWLVFSVKSSYKFGSLKKQTMKELSR